MELGDVYKNVYLVLQDLFKIKTVKKSLLEELPSSNSFQDLYCKSNKKLFDLVRVKADKKESDISNEKDIFNFIPVLKSNFLNLSSIVETSILKDPDFNILFETDSIPITNPLKEILIVNKGRGIGEYHTQEGFYIYKILIDNSCGTNSIIPIAVVFSDKVIPIKEGIESIFTQVYTRSVETKKGVDCGSTSPYLSISQIKSLKLCINYTRVIRLWDLRSDIKYIYRFNNEISQFNYYLDGISFRDNPLLSSSFNLFKEYSVLPNYYNLVEFNNLSLTLNQELKEDREFLFEDLNQGRIVEEVTSKTDNFGFLLFNEVNNYSLRYKESYNLLKESNSIFPINFPFNYLESSYINLLDKVGLIHTYKNHKDRFETMLYSNNNLDCFYIEPPEEYIENTICPHSIKLDEDNKALLDNFTIIPKGIPKELDINCFYPKDKNSYKVFTKGNPNTLSLKKELTYFLYIATQGTGKHLADGAMITIVPAVHNIENDCLSNPILFIHFYSKCKDKKTNQNSLFCLGQSHRRLYSLITKESTTSYYIPFKPQSYLTKGQLARQEMLDRILEHNWVYRYENQPEFVLRSFISFESSNSLAVIKACSYFYQFMDYLPKFKHQDVFLGGKKKNVL